MVRIVIVIIIILFLFSIMEYGTIIHGNSIERDRGQIPNQTCKWNGRPKGQ